MRGNKKAECDGCGKTFNTKSLRKLNGGCYCHKCSLKKSKCIIPVVPKKIPKSYIQTKKKVRKKVESKVPKIKGAKERKASHKGLKRGFGIYLDKDEKASLYRDLIVRGFTREETNERIKKLVEKQQELSKAIRQEAKEKNWTESQMNQKFLESLEKSAKEGATCKNTAKILYVKK